MSEDRVYPQSVELRGVSRGAMTEGDSYDGKTKGSQWGAVEEQYKWNEMEDWVIDWMNGWVYKSI